MYVQQSFRYIKRSKKKKKKKMFVGRLSMCCRITYEGTNILAVFSSTCPSTKPAAYMYTNKAHFNARNFRTFVPPSAEPPISRLALVSIYNSGKAKAKAKAKKKKNSGRSEERKGSRPGGIVSPEIPSRFREHKSVVRDTGGDTRPAARPFRRRRRRRDRLKTRGR